MKTRITKKQMGPNRFPTRLHVLREVKIRKGLDRELEEELLKLENEFKARQEFLKFMEILADDDWFVMQDVWIESRAITVKCEVLIVSEVGLYPFILNPFQGEMVFIGHMSYANFEEILHHPIYDVMNVQEALELLVDDEVDKKNVQGHLVFTDPNTRVYAEEMAFSYEVSTRDQIGELIYKIREREEQYKGKKENQEKFLSLLEEKSIDEPYPPRPLSDAVKERMYKGIYCLQCGSFDVDIDRSYVHCDCGMHEPKNQAVNRTFREYIHLNPQLDLDKNHDLRPNDFELSKLLEFFRYQIPHETLSEYIDDYFSVLD